MSGRHGLRLASLVLGGWSPVRAGDARMGTLACKADVLKSACISGALAVVKVTAYWSSRCSAIWWYRTLQAVTKGQVRAVV